MAVDAWSLAYAPDVSVFTARSGFTPGWVVAHTVVVTMYCFPCL